MAIKLDTLLSWPFKDVVQSYTARDSILYALSVGLGADPIDHDQLRFVYENGLEAFPTMALVLGYPGPWAADPQSGIDVSKLVFGEQQVTWHSSLPPATTIRARERIVNVIDKGEGRGALVYVQRQIFDHSTEQLLVTLDGTLFCRGNGGFGGPDGPIREPWQVPERDPDCVVEMPTLPQAALLYRLNADYNPLHADPKFALAAGFPRPILHGLCTFAIAAQAALKTYGGLRADRLRSLRARFTAPVYPGEVLSVELWRDDNSISFRVWVRERNTKVLDGGHAIIIQKA
ncbi:MAG: 3-alpha,7-alpha,12-alpha-trihydroxy-5-beta-cholest-24-enoyl-CoA hydratase [Betaproteobacteria bacterium HGW-Betaproteobacteria-5]|jgi:acyl dehydratase|nr:MAG: 3-alpha,7-alpha,12-alpha-trihydroxy-5-beta-cholest-24-enoyl-CoA hydratase [Betaproteobacteria bacterium HGW-Betaproteobacteria-5]PKO41155.1 MAG: 3-alpha,7-alpha,12-alpha-trihydroxy-5-beta-cholest-24-enoyl-CoA hydratase [Betaproteobacteria bacterium HGW-Betaproteobacteria-6]